MTGIKENTVNGRVHELLDPENRRVVEAGERDGRGVLYTVEWHAESLLRGVTRRAG